ncbi:uncharacterized protein RCC_06912 [Ramularia collo-cygni]|uniref:Uncharacterized protein n=1 Tax=Ramularia collo-cygni TaxID=112498 RepID=A0A2D3UWB5_9PEZI|nr:uncharacterized protein RCC_06912 [Ramularia collo-cygni]CZT21051.1 uncharacterized protein RCC_06912 [Ramularia collo-cygni]
MDSKMASEQILSPPPSDATKEGTSESSSDIQSTRSQSPAAEDSVPGNESTVSATPATENMADPTPTNDHRSEADFRERRRKERCAVTRGVNKLIKSIKGPMVDPKDRTDLILKERKKCIKDLGLSGQASARECYPSEYDEQEEINRLLKNCFEYVNALEKAPATFENPQKKESYRATEQNEDDEEVVTYKPPNIKREAVDDEGSRTSVAQVSEILSSKIVAGMAITRGFGDARLAADSSTERSAPRSWKFIGGRWVPIPPLSCKFSGGSTKRKLESADREDGGKKTRMS